MGIEGGNQPGRIGAIPTVDSVALAGVASASGPAPAAEIGPMESILAALREGERFLVCSHSRPDGDAVGSMLAMAMLLDQMGKRADMVTADRVPAVYRGLPWANRIQTVLSVQGLGGVGHLGQGLYDAAILIECDSVERTRLKGLEPYRLINIDHHASGRRYGALNWIEKGASAAGELIYRLAKASGATVTPAMATCLYAALLTDTGGFCYGGLTADTFGLARELVLAGANPGRVAQEVYFANPPAKMKLLGAALSNLRLNRPIAWLWVTHADMRAADAAEEDCEGIVNYAISIAGVEVAAFFRELPEGRIRLSLRSKSATNNRIHVAAVAARLGGGGHENAAGVTLDGPLDAARELILALLAAEFAGRESAGPA